MSNKVGRNFYACQCFFKGKTDKLASYGKTIYVFKSDKARADFLADKEDKNEFYIVTQKEAYKIADLNGSKSVACVYKHSHYTKNYVLANIRQCWGNAYQLLKDFQYI